MRKITKKYTNGKITVIWKPDLCIHSGACFSSLPKVFIPYERPWIKIKEASTEDIISTVKLCPSAALSYYFNTEGTTSKHMEPNVQICLLDKGPLMVKGNIKLVNIDENEIVTTEETTALCRCGASKNKPFCDGSHAQIDFKC